MNKGFVRAGLNALYFSRVHRLLPSGGIGAILVLHHVRPPRDDAFQPNRTLEVTPGFFEEVIVRVRQSGNDIVSLDEMHRRLSEGSVHRRFICLTFDDGYRDNFEWAYPILKKHQVPFTIFIVTSFADGFGDLWWLVLETVISRNNRIYTLINGKDRHFDCASVNDKRGIFGQLYRWLHGLHWDERSGVIRQLAERYAVDVIALRRKLCMSWAELAEVAADPLATIGAHTVNHIALKKANEATVRSEMQLSAGLIETALGVRPRHFAYPYGNRAEAGAREFRIAAELGFKTAVTTRPGVLFPKHRDLVTALPRIVLDGEFQHWRYVEVLLSGTERMLWSGVRRIDEA
jgi:peptidoglycan/xylan/chitin deacetylase (PgdA/CDA1 family)